MVANKWIVQIVGSTKATAPERLAESKTVLRALFEKLSQNYSRLWIFWNGGMPDLINRTKEYSSLDEQDEQSVSTLWAALVSRSRIVWETRTHAAIVEAAALDEGEVAEQALVEFEVNEPDEVEAGSDFGEDDLEELDGDREADGFEVLGMEVDGHDSEAEELYVDADDVDID